MRELVFRIEYDHGADPVMDVFIDHPELRARSLACHASLRGVWRLDWITGPPAAVETLEDVFLDDGHCNDCLRTPGCTASPTYDVVSETAGGKVVYTSRTETDRCSSIPRLAREWLEGGLLFQATRSDDSYEWRVLMQRGDAVGKLTDAIQRSLGAQRRFDLRYLGEVTERERHLLTGPPLPYEQRLALERAVETGYYETPRETTLEELAADLEVPRSTLSYRLRRAEARLVRAFAAPPGDASSSD